MSVAFGMNNELIGVWETKDFDLRTKFNVCNKVMMVDVCDLLNYYAIHHTQSCKLCNQSFCM